MLQRDCYDGRVHETPWLGYFFMTSPMILVRVATSDSAVRVGRWLEDRVELLGDPDGALTLSEILDAENPLQFVESLCQTSTTVAKDQVTLLPPVDRQEVWAAGVTYTRSKSARMEESEAAASCYDRVYVSPRPELFMKATPHRVVGCGQGIRIRQDATWNVPEPELTLVMNRRLELVGFTIGNDMSSRDIEGENPLYLPQAKVYDECCGLGPGIVLAESVTGSESWPIELQISRSGETVFQGTTNVDQMARTFDELIGWLGRDQSFPDGVLLMTGTGIVPDSDFTLMAGDEVQITIGPLGTLTNGVVQR
jgi:2-dehydro-3-deoxy-D-arabinonate dehydratase